MRYCFAVTVKLPFVALRQLETDLARFRVFGHIRTGVRRNDQDSGGRGAFVSQLMASGRASWKRHHVPLAELPVAVAEANGWVAP